MFFSPHIQSDLDQMTNFCFSALRNSTLTLALCSSPENLHLLGFKSSDMKMYDVSVHFSSLIKMSDVVVILPPPCFYTYCTACIALLHTYSIDQEQKHEKFSFKINLQRLRKQKEQSQYECSSKSQKPAVTKFTASNQKHNTRLSSS